MLRTIDTPIGPLLLTADADGLSRVDFVAVRLGRNEESKGHRKTNQVRGEESGGVHGASTSAVQTS